MAEVNIPGPTNRKSLREPWGYDSPAFETTKAAPVVGVQFRIVLAALCPRMLTQAGLSTLVLCVYVPAGIRIVPQPPGKARIAALIFAPIFAPANSVAFNSPFMEL